MSKKSKIPKLSKVYKEMIMTSGNDQRFREYLLTREKKPIGLHNSLIEEIRQYLNIEQIWICL